MTTRFVLLSLPLLMTFGASSACDDTKPASATDPTAATSTTNGADVPSSGSADATPDPTTATTQTTASDTVLGASEDVASDPTSASDTVSEATAEVSVDSGAVEPNDTTEVVATPECTVKEDCQSFACTCPDGAWAFQWCGDDGTCLGADACDLACADHQVAGCSANSECPKFQCTCPDGYASSNWQWCNSGTCQGAANCAQACASSGHSQAPSIYPHFGDDCLYGYECDWPGFQGECLMTEGQMVGFCTIQCANNSQCPNGWSCGLADGIHVCH